MNSKKLAGITTLILILFLGCSGTNVKLKTQSETESKATQQKLIKNWSDYDIWLFYPSGYRPPQLLAIIFDPNNDDRKILVGSDWRKVKDQEMWTGIVKENTTKVKDQEMWTGIVKENTTSGGDFKIRRDYSDGTSTVQEIWGPDNQLYGYAINTEIWLAYTRLVEENTLRLEILRRDYNVTTAPP
jgi:hypothetical protein